MLKTTLSDFDTICAFSRARDLARGLRGYNVIVFPRGRKIRPTAQNPDVDRIKELFQEIFNASGTIQLGMAPEIQIDLWWTWYQLSGPDQISR